MLLPTLSLCIYNRNQQMDINDAVEIASRGHNNTLNNGQRIVVNAYIESVLEDEQHIGDIGWVMATTQLYEELLNLM